MNTLSLSNFRNQLPRVIKEVDEKYERVIITVNGEAKAMLLSPQEIESYEETIRTLSEKESIEALFQAEKDWESGNIYSHEEVFA